MMGKKLTSKDLMIGDWVNIKDYEDPCQIESLGKCDVDTNELDEVEYENLEPIPITENILEKNGFEIGFIGGKIEIDGFIILCDCKHIIIEHEDREILKISCLYVHELQHALRLSGIGREIEL